MLRGPVVSKIDGKNGECYVFKLRKHYIALNRSVTISFLPVAASFVIGVYDHQGEKSEVRTL